MARTTETEVADLRETARPESVGNHDSLGQEGAEKQELKRNAPRAKLSRWILLSVFALALVGATAWWLNARNYESTDDAQIEGHLDLDYRAGRGVPQTLLSELARPPEMEWIARGVRILL
jgi:hypothetical protein